MDKNAAVTFDNVSYPLQLENKNAWYLALQYIRSQARHELNLNQKEATHDQVKHQIEKYEVFVRKTQDNPQQKDVIMVVKTPATGNQLTQIELQPSSTLQNLANKLQVTVTKNNKKQRVEYNEQKSTDIHDGAIQVYALPNGEVKIDVRGAYHIIYDGERFKLTATHDQFRNSIRGLCGNFNGEQDDDLMAPKGCIFRDSKDFEESYALLLRAGQEPQQVQQEQQDQQKRNNHEQICVNKQQYYGNVISDIDAGRASLSKQSAKLPKRHSENTVKKTVYANEDGNVCFSIRPVASCKNGYEPLSSVMRDIPVHCVQKSNVATLWRNQIDEGNGLDFSRKIPTKTIKMKVSTSCTN